MATISGAVSIVTGIARTSGAMVRLTSRRRRVSARIFGSSSAVSLAIACSRLACCAGLAT